MSVYRITSAQATAQSRPRTWQASKQLRRIFEVFAEVNSDFRQMLRKAETGPRINTRQVLAAFQESERMPADSGDPEGVTALELLFPATVDQSRLDHHRRIYATALRAAEQYGEIYSCGFSDGWDQDWQLEEWVNDILIEGVNCWHPAYVIGRSDGKAARLAADRRAYAK